MHALIFANGKFTPPLQPLPSAELIIAADGGARHCLNLGLTPHLVIGDLDSLTPQEVADLEEAGIQLIRHPPAKDETDLELALDLARARGAAQITLLASLGGRPDMTFANLLLLAHSRFAGVDIRVLDGEMEMFVLRGGQTCTLHGKPGDTVSVLPLAGDALGLTYRGLKYPLENATLSFASPRGVSNVMTEETAEISLREGICFVFRTFAAQ